MEVDAVKELCSGYPGASSKLLGAPSNVLVYYVGGKKFAYFKTSEPEQWRFSFRAPQGRFLELTDVPGFKPARYLARFHWVTIVDVRTVPKKQLCELIASSYEMALVRPARRRSSTGTRARSDSGGP